jgi:hypothetical protein
MIILPVSLMPDRVLAVCDSAQHSAAECFINKQPKSATRFFSVFIVRLLDVLAAQNDAPLHFSGCDAPCWHSLFETPQQDRVMFRLSSPASPSKVTLVTQLTVNRLKRLILSARLWRNDSPVAAAIYINSPMEIIQLFFYLLTAGETLMGRLSIAIVIPATETVAGGYPINKLRNTALLMVRTRALLMIESDFIPSADLYLQASTTIVPYLYRRYRKDLPFTAVVIPCFGLSPAVEEPVRDVRELRRLIDQSLAYVTDSGSGHGPTRNSLFLAFDAPSIKKEQSPHVSKPETPHNQLVESEHFYETCYEGQWEPYYILYSPESACYLNVGDENARKSYFDTPDGWLSKQSKCIRPFVTASSSVGSWDVPLYDARFTNQGGDKQSHAAWMNALGTRFMVYRHGFLSHIAHGRMSWVGQGFRPGTRKSWDYFGDFLGSLQARFGRMFRWPRGCSYPFHRDQDRRIVVV